MLFPRPLLPPITTTFLPRKRCALLNSFMAQSFHKDTIQFYIFSGYPVVRSGFVHAMNALAKRRTASRWVASEKWITSSPISAVLVHLLQRSKPVTLTLALLLVPVAFPQSITRHLMRSAEPMLHQAAKRDEKRSQMTHRSLA